MHLLYDARSVYVGSRRPHTIYLSGRTFVHIHSTPLKLRPCAAIHHQDFAILRAMVFLGSALHIVGLILTDISYTLVDPRVRLDGAGP